MFSYWLGWLVVVGALGGFVVTLVHVWRSMGEHRSGVIERATSSALGDGERVVLSFDCSGRFPYRLAASGLVWGFSSWHDLTHWLNNDGVRFLDERDKWTARRAFAPDVCLSHPAFIK